MNNTNTTVASASATTPWSGVTNTGTLNIQGQLFPPGIQSIGSSSMMPNQGSMIGSGSYGFPGTSISPPFTQTYTSTPIQSSFTFYKWNFGYDFPKKLFESGDPVVPVLFITNSCAMMFHISVWITVCSPNEHDYGVVWDGKISKYASLVGGAIGSDNTEGVLMIKEGKTLEEFKTWWAEYTARFHNDSWQTEQFPLIKEGIEISGCPVAHGEIVSYNGMQIMATDKLFDRWCWIVENTHQPVWFTDTFWFFNNTAEMLMYKLIDEK